jgi:hypothetical protein
MPCLYPVPWAAIRGSSGGPWIPWLNWSWRFRAPSLWRDLYGRNEISTAVEIDPRIQIF